MPQKLRRSKRVHVVVTQEDIDQAKCGDPNRCMIHVALKRAINMAHGYVHVTTNGIYITRRDDYRERAFVPNIAAQNIVLFDDGKKVKPFDFWLEFLQHTKVVKVSRHRREQINEARRKAGRPVKKYNISQRVAGVAFRP